MAHRKHPAYYEHPITIDPIEEGFDLCEAVEEEVRDADDAIDLAELLMRDTKRIWRRPERPGVDLIVIQTVTRTAPSSRSLQSLFSSALERDNLEQALRNSPKRFRRLAEFVLEYCDVIRQTQRQRRYQRLKSNKARARLLAVALSHPKLSLVYAERIEKRRRGQPRLPMFKEELLEILKGLDA